MMVANKNLNKSAFLLLFLNDLMSNLHNTGNVW